MVIDEETGLYYICEILKPGKWPLSDPGYLSWGIEGTGYAAFICVLQE